MQPSLKISYHRIVFLFLFLNLYLQNLHKLWAQEISTSQIDSVILVASELIQDNNNDSTLILTSFALDKSIELDYYLGQARAQVVESSYYLNKAQLDSSEILFTRAEEIYTENGLIGDTIQSKYHYLFLTRGAWNIYKRNFAEAERLLTMGAKLFLKEGDNRRYNNCLNSLGRINGMKGNYAQALDYFLKAYDLNEGKESLNASVILGNIALCYKYLGHVEKATQYFKEGLEMDIKNGWRSQMNKYNGLATIYKQLDNLDSAIYYDKKAFEAAQEFGNYSTAVISLGNLAQYYVLKQEFDLANTMMNEALQLADSVGIKSVEEQFDIIKAEVFYDEQQYDSTLYYARRALASTSQYSHRKFSSIITHLMSNTFEQLGVLDSSLYYLKTHHAYEDSLFNKESQKKVTELYTKMETLEKEKEINLLQKNKELEAVKKQRLLVLIFAILMVAGLLVVTLIYRYKGKLRKEELKQIKLQNDLEQGQADLYKQTLNMIHMNNLMDSLESQVKEIITKKSDPEYRKILHTIKMNKSLKKDWENFNNYFSNSHSEFYEKLTSLNDKLSNHEKRVCALIKLNLSNREIATILNIENRSAVMIKYRIKKKIGLEEHNDLNKYVQQL
ncbi:Tetratricopeptide repeat-containing protein [Reichenbachiella faecimaris]|uniref:Tetratricopeptide repeat-containing protein n=1 Tax=Reichenbachiella faecimaris TaxID=692418 RepID=A0A1W2GRQ8_REIFA|nr:tetratricopeptide repeat protein [Reichenbachiella faecimaris]SMD39102.1 Tetratricopeptide repeat-containing protein [Reichenbachiella faecimaris]